MDEEVKCLKYSLEDSVGQEYFAHHQRMYYEAFEPPPWLVRFETPFKWARILKRALLCYPRWYRLHDYENQGSFNGFERFAFLLVIIQRRMHTRLLPEEEEVKNVKGNHNVVGDNDDEDNESENDEECRPEYFYELDEALEKCEETLEEMAADKEVIYNRIGPVLRHVLKSTKAHILFSQGKISESQELAKQIQDVDEMSPECKAGIEGLKVEFIMSMYQDYTVLLPHLSKAIELDPQFGYWHFLTGRVIWQLRKRNGESVVNEELEHFGNAVKLERNPKFLVFLAQTYREMARKSSRRHVADNLRQKAADLYRETWMLKNDSALISRRVANGMMKMDNRFFDKEVTKAAVLKANELSCCKPILFLGKFYYDYEKDDEKALEIFETRCPRDYFATTEIIRLNLIKHPDYDPGEVLQQIASNKHSVHCDCGWYYLMYKNDLETSVKHFWEVLKVDYNSYKVLDFNSYGFLVKGPVNMVEVLVNEILLLKVKNESLPPKERKDLEFLEKFLENVLEKHPKLRDLSPDPNLLGSLKTKVQKEIEYKRRSRYGSGNGRGEYSLRWNKPRGERNDRRVEGADFGNIGEHNGQPKNKGRNMTYNNWLGSTNYGSDRRNDTRGSLCEADNRSSRTDIDDHRRSSEAQCSQKNERPNVKQGTMNRLETNNRFSGNCRGRNNRQPVSSRNSRYDVTVTNWRKEHKGE